MKIIKIVLGFLIGAGIVNSTIRAGMAIARPSANTPAGGP